MESLDTVAFVKCVLIRALFANELPPGYISGLIRSVVTHHSDIWSEKSSTELLIALEQITNCSNGAIDLGTLLDIAVCIIFLFNTRR